MSTEVAIVPPSEIPQAALQLGHRNPDIGQGWSERASREELVMFAICRDGLYCASVNLLVGGADEQPVRDEIGDTPMMFGLGVNANYRRQGLGSRLVESCEDYIRRRRDLPQQLALGVSPDNAIARSLYEGRGYAYRKIGGQDQFESSWYGMENGQKVLRTVHPLLMVKQL